MVNFLKIKKRNIAIFLLLIFNQLLLKGYSLNNRKFYKDETTKNSFIEKYKNEFSDLYNKKTKDNILKMELLAQSDSDTLDSEIISNKNEDLKEEVNVDKLDNETLYEDLKRKYITNIEIENNSEFTWQCMFVFLSNSTLASDIPTGLLKIP